MPVEAILIEEALKSGLLHIDETSCPKKEKLL
jgi:hypothetical protein